MKTLASVCVVLVALALMTSVASADKIRVYYDFATTGIGTGSGIWSVTVDSGQIPDGVDPDGNTVYLDPNTAVTFMAAMATPDFNQIDALFEGDVVPDTPGLVGWANDGDDRGRLSGMAWVFYGPNDVVTLRAITEDFTDYTFEVQTRLAFSADDDEGGSNRYYYAVTCADNLEGLDAGNGTEWRPVSYWGDVINGQGHRHSGNRFRNDTPPEATPTAGQTWFTDGKDGFMDSGVDGDGIGVKLGFRRTDGSNALSTTGSMFFSDCMFGGDVFADTDDIK